MPYNYYRLSNGIRLIHRQSTNLVAHCAFMVNTGSRDEKEHENGLAHLIEHMIFKGTGKRNSYHILNRLEHVGGDLNAYTTKEETCIHASFLPEHLNRALELFSDLSFNSTFPAKEIEKEKAVILDEINSYRDNPSDEIFDEFENLIFRNHPIGRNILGTPEHLSRLKRQDIFRFISRNYSTTEMVISLVAPIGFKKFIKAAEHFFGEIKSEKARQERPVFNSYEPRQEYASKKGYLSHCTIGNIAFPQNHPLRHAMILLNNILGGPGMNSRLNLGIREKYGFCYSIESHFTSYSDVGVFVLYFGTDPRSLDKTKSLVMKELTRLIKQPLSIIQLERAKKQLTGQLAISFESGMSEALAIARAHLNVEVVDDMTSLTAKINQISQNDLQLAASEVFDPSLLSSLTYVSEEKN
jgi:predicted Zn-dependent peptidase